MKIISQFQREAAAKAVRLEVLIKPGTVVDSDTDLLSLILQNLVGNGVKYSSAGSVRIGCDFGDREDFSVIWVSDDGHGIAADKIGNIFEGFKRGEIHGQQGLGLGLAIASQAAALLGGRLEVQSTLDVGTTFRLILPQTVPDPIKAAIPNPLLYARL
jgi:signal transduction histidine kinase